MARTVSFGWGGSSSTSRGFASAALALGCGLLAACSGGDAGGGSGGNDTRGSGGALGAGASTGDGGTSGAGTGSFGGSWSGGGGTSTGGSSAAGGASGGGDSGGAGGSSSHAPRSMGYVGCSMSDNVASGYAAAGGDRLWPSLPEYWGQVVQDWADPTDPVWNTFDAQVDAFGVPDAVWIMVCIFNPPGVEIQEMRDIVGLVRQRAPNATIYTTGQPFYDPGADCSVAGAAGPQTTDDMAQAMATDSSLTDVHYAGQFGPLAANQKSDGCHANEAGQLELGQQAIEFFGD